MLIANHACWAPLTKHPGNSLNVTPTGGFLDREGSGSKDIWSSCNFPTTKKLKQNPSGGERCDAAPPQVAELRDNNPKNMVEIGCKKWVPDASIWKGMVEDSQPQKPHKQK